MTDRDPGIAVRVDAGDPDAVPASALPDSWDLRPDDVWCGTCGAWHPEDFHRRRSAEARLEAQRRASPVRRLLMRLGIIGQ